MAIHPFVDYVKIYFTSGKGGSGAVSWRREKFVPKGGPNGGDGGEGGSVYVRGNRQLWTLLDLKYRKYITAEDAGNGQDNNKKGKNGASIFLDVPLGTMLKDAETQEMIGEITEEGQELMLLKGGRGGKGNTFFKTATHQAPDMAQPGEDARERVVIMELKVLADVGLVGFPNAGKSTLLSVLSEAKPKIADYPFTTLVPNLGIVRYKDYQSFVMADIPGIIEGASEGKGLGTQFLRHIERNSVLLFMVAADCEDISKEYEILLNEIDQFNPELMDKPRLLAITKSDLLDKELEKGLTKEVKKLKIPYLFISAIAQIHINQLKDILWKMING